MRWFTIQPKRSRLQKRAQRAAIETYRSNPEKYKDTMFCPFCGKPLILSGKKKKLETLTEHVSGYGYVSEKDEYVCSGNHYTLSSDIPGCRFGAMHSWNGDPLGIENGGSFTSDFRYNMVISIKSPFEEIVYDYLLDLERPHKFHNALNTFEAEHEVSSSRNGLPDVIRLWPWLTFGIIQLTINFHYKANKFGEVTRTDISLGYLCREKDYNGRTYCIVGIWPWTTWRFLMRHFIRNKKSATSFLKKNGENEEYYLLLRKCYRHSFNRSWRYRLFESIIKFFNPRDIKKLKNHYNNDADLFSPSFEI